MTLYKMIKGIVTEKRTEDRCSECGQKFKYPANSPYKPKTCSYDCEFKRQHPGLDRVRR